MKYRAAVQPFKGLSLKLSGRIEPIQCWDGRRCPPTRRE